VEGRYFRVEPPETRPAMMEAFRADPEGSPLKTPSGKIELYSEVVAGFGYADCPGHATWNVPDEWAGGADAEFPLHLLGKQPANKLHSQLDPGAWSKAAKVKGREAVEISPQDAAARGIADGDIVEVRNGRGTCLCGAVVTPDLMPGVVMISTGAWYDPEDAGSGGRCRHGNPNVLSPDVGTSALSQGPAAHSCLVEVTRLEGDAPDVQAFEPPAFAPRTGDAQKGDV